MEVKPLLSIDEYFSTQPKPLLAMEEYFSHGRVDVQMMHGRKVTDDDRKDLFKMKMANDMPKIAVTNTLAAVIGYKYGGQAGGFVLPKLTALGWTGWNYLASQGSGKDFWMDYISEQATRERMDGSPLDTFSWAYTMGDVFDLGVKNSDDTWKHAVANMAGWIAGDQFIASGLTTKFNPLSKTDALGTLLNDGAILTIASGIGEGLRTYNRFIGEGHEQDYAMKQAVAHGIGNGTATGSMYFFAYGMPSALRSLAPKFSKTVEKSNLLTATDFANKMTYWMGTASATRRSVQAGMDLEPEPAMGFGDYAGAYLSGLALHGFMSAPAGVLKGIGKIKNKSALKQEGVNTIKSLERGAAMSDMANSIHKDITLATGEIALSGQEQALAKNEINLLAKHIRNLVQENPNSDANAVFVDVLKNIDVSYRSKKNIREIIKAYSDIADVRLNLNPDEAFELKEAVSKLGGL